MPHVSRVRPGLPGQAQGRNIADAWCWQVPRVARAGRGDGLTGAFTRALGEWRVREGPRGLPARDRAGSQGARPVLLWHNLDHLGRAYEALLDLQEARRV